MYIQLWIVLMLAMTNNTYGMTSNNDELTTKDLLKSPFMDFIIEEYKEKQSATKRPISEIVDEWNNTAAKKHCLDKMNTPVSEEDYYKTQCPRCRSDIKQLRKEQLIKSINQHPCFVLTQKSTKDVTSEILTFVIKKPTKYYSILRLCPLFSGLQKNNKPCNYSQRSLRTATAFGQQFQILRSHITRSHSVSAEFIAKITSPDYLSKYIHIQESDQKPESDEIYQLTITH